MSRNQPQVTDRDVPAFFHVWVVKRENLAKRAEALRPALHPWMRGRCARSVSKKKEGFLHDSDRSSTR